MNNQIHLHHSLGVMSKLHQRATRLLSVIQSLARSWMLENVLLLLFRIPFLMNSGGLPRTKTSFLPLDTNHSIQKKLESLHVDSDESRHALNHLFIWSQK